MYQKSKTGKQPDYIKDARKIMELEESLKNISEGDGKAIEDYTQKEVVAEAEYVLSCYFECGHMMNEELHESDQSIRLKAWNQVRQLKSFIKKYKTEK